MAIHSNTKAPKEINLMMVPLLQAAINGHIMQLIIKRRLKIFHILLLPSIFPTFSYPCTKPPTAPAIVPTPISQGAASAAIGGETCANAMLAPRPAPKPEMPPTTVDKEPNTFKQKNNKTRELIK